MKSIKMNDKEIFQISDLDLSLLASELPEVDEDIERRLKWIIEHKCDRIYDRFRTKWTQILIKEGVTSLPTGRDEFITLVINRPDYKNASQQ
jgi:hypothetical protein